MRGGRRENTGRKRRKLNSKMPRVEFDMNAIKEIQERKGRVCKRWSNRKRAV